MFGWFKSRQETNDKKRYEAKMAEALAAQRRGDIQSFAVLTKEAEDIWAEIEAQKGKA